VSTENQPATITLRELSEEFGLDYNLCYSWVRRKRLTVIRREGHGLIVSRVAAIHTVRDHQERKAMRAGDDQEVDSTRSPDERTFSELARDLEIGIHTLKNWFEKGKIFKVGKLGRAHLFSLAAVKHYSENRTRAKRTPPPIPLRPEPEPTPAPVFTLKVATHPDRFEHDYLPEGR
jgi:hypothetical protein